MTAIRTYFDETSQEVDRALSRYLPKATIKPATLHQAMRYSIFAGGKRLRPILTLAAANACGGNNQDALPAACAVECVHTYSLIHDDLPCMDNDDFRRGKPTSHKVYGEGIAVLAGDALLSLAFEIIANTTPTKRYAMADFVRELADSSGSRKLIAGQVADIENEGKSVTPQQLQYIHLCKTSALLTSAIRLGAMSANATPLQLEALSNFGTSLGLAFQIIDDILDVTQTAEKLGKSAGKDIAAQKATYPAIFGLEKSRLLAKKQTEKAIRSLEPLKRKATTLLDIANYMLQRDY